MRPRAWLLAPLFPLALAVCLPAAPADDPKIVVAVMVENGESGSGVAAPVVRQIMDAWLLADDGKLKPEYGGPPSSTEVTASEE